MTQRQERQERQFKLVTLRERPELEDILSPIEMSVWPEFMFYDTQKHQQTFSINQVFDQFQYYFLDELEQPIASAMSMPCFWDGSIAGLPSGWSGAFVRGMHDYEVKRVPNTLCALVITISPEYQNQG